FKSSRPDHLSLLIIPKSCDQANATPLNHLGWLPIVEQIRLDPLINKPVRFKLHELAETKEATIRAFDELGYWIEGGSLAEYLKRTTPCSDAGSEIQFLEYKRIQWVQKVNSENRPPGPAKNPAISR